MTGQQNRKMQECIHHHINGTHISIEFAQFLANLIREEAFEITRYDLEHPLLNDLFKENQLLVSVKNVRDTCGMSLNKAAIIGCSLQHFFWPKIQEPPVKELFS